MRIQHNIMAMNAYRNYNTNTSSLSKNLEKLSSGYKINRAGDDAAGLAISEKMRAQITGLEVAQKNAKDGISLVQTAEGALTEVHDMLNRMVELANQSANGTYENTTDRNQLQKEVNQLRSEINRIADSANFNGINLLDGSMDANGATGGKPIDVSSAVTVSKVKADGVTAKYPEFTVDLEGLEITNSASSAGSVQIKVGTATFTLKANGASKGKAYDSTKLTMAKVSGQSLGGLKYDVTYAGGKLVFKAATSVTDTEAALKAPGVTLNPSYNVTIGTPTNANVTGNIINPGTQIIQDGKAPVDSTPAVAEFALSANMIADGNTITIGDQNFSIDFSAKGTSAATGKIGVKDLLTPDGKFDSAKLNEVASRITKAAGTNATFIVGNKGGGVLTLQSRANVATTTKLSTEAEVKAQIKVSGSAGSGQALTLQIGDTSDSFNQIQVSIKDCHVGSLGISAIDISKQTNAQAAVSKIKDAINYVSDVRGTLGATQNRLDHTINNLSVMTENIQDAESTIRDTDVADEMMAYTKNNILIQSAQAMLAQANQVPQGVLQLLQ